MRVIKDVRMIKFLAELEGYLGERSCYDEETDEDIIEGTEEECYDILMKTQDFHLLGEEVVQKLIHIGFTDFKAYTEIQHTKQGVINLE
jgi:hypothetical protein